MWHLEAEPCDRFREFRSVLCHPDRARIGPDQLDAMTLQYPTIVELERYVQGCLAPHCWEERIWALPLYDPLDPLGRDRLDIGPIRQVGIGHDRRRITIDEYDPVSLLTECAHRLSTRIVELTALRSEERRVGRASGAR